MSAGDRMVAHLNTRFLFPFSIDVEEVKAANPGIWTVGRRWIEGLDQLVCDCRRSDEPVLEHLGTWKRDPYTDFDLDSPSYQDLVFFHPFTRRVFFDVAGENAGTDHESLLRFYRLAPPENTRLLYFAEDLSGRSAEVQVESLQLLLFANGIGILSMGTEVYGISTEEALWINESMRKVYPSSGRQIRECRAPWKSALVLERSGERIVVADHDYRKGKLVHLLPPLARTITSLLYFLDYADQEYEPVLDERMVVYSYICLDPVSLPEGYKDSDEYKILISRFLYVDRAGPDYRYDSRFIRQYMKAHTYTRWAHYGTYYGFTGFSNITITTGMADQGTSRAEEGGLVHRIFRSRYYIMAIIALFYRSTLLDYSERIALVSKQLYLDQWYGRLHLDHIQLMARVRAEFLHFNTHWYFDELTNKDEESEHFRLQCLQYRTEVMRQDLERELDALNMSLHTFHQFRNTEAVNRLAIISMILGGGAVVTGFFGMNFGHLFDSLLNPQPGREWTYWMALTAAAVMTLGILSFGVWTIIANWPDYRNSLMPRRLREGWVQSKRLRKPRHRV